MRRSSCYVPDFSLHQILMKLEFPLQIFENYLNINFNENPSSGSHVVPCGRTDRHTDTRKLTAAFRNFAKAPKSTCMSKMNNQFSLYSEFVDKFDREFIEQYSYNSVFLKYTSLWQISCEILYSKIHKTIINTKVPPEEALTADCRIASCVP